MLKFVGCHLGRTSNSKYFAIIFALALLVFQGAKAEICHLKLAKAKSSSTIVFQNVGEGITDPEHIGDLAKLLARNFSNGMDPYHHNIPEIQRQIPAMIIWIHKAIDLANSFERDYSKGEIDFPEGIELGLIKNPIKAQEKAELREQGRDALVQDMHEKFANNQVTYIYYLEVIHLTAYLLSNQSSLARFPDFFETNSIRSTMEMRLLLEDPRIFKQPFVAAFGNNLDPIDFIVSLGDYNFIGLVPTFVFAAGAFRTPTVFVAHDYLAHARHVITVLERLEPKAKKALLQFKADYLNRIRPKIKPALRSQADWILFEIIHAEMLIQGATAINNLAEFAQNPNSRNPIWMDAIDSIFQKPDHPIKIEKRHVQNLAQFIINEYRQLDSVR